MILSNVDLKPFNTFGISVPAKKFATFGDIESLRSLLQNNPNDQLLILGGGSNLLLTKPVDALVLKNEIMGIEVVRQSDQEVWVEAGAGVVWHDFVRFCIDHGYAGVENLSLIPGSVGASPMQNIGAYGVEIKDVFDHLKAFHIASGEVHSFTNQDCEFGYRESVFKNKFKGQYIITHVCYRLRKEARVNTSYGAIETELKARGITNPGISDVSNAVIAIRQSKLPDPKVIGNAGSFFKNPVIPSNLFEQIKAQHPDVPSYPAQPGFIKVPAGWLIEKAGWKGLTKGNYGVHKNQALVLVNYGGATGQEIWQLSSDIIQDIEAKFGVQLEREVNIL